MPSISSEIATVFYVDVETFISITGTLLSWLITFTQIIATGHKGGVNGFNIQIMILV